MRKTGNSSRLIPKFRCPPPQTPEKQKVIGKKAKPVILTKYSTIKNLESTDSSTGSDSPNPLEFLLSLGRVHAEVIEDEDYRTVALWRLATLDVADPVADLELDVESLARGALAAEDGLGTAVGITGAVKGMNL